MGEQPRPGSAVTRAEAGRILGLAGGSWNRQLKLFPMRWSRYYLSLVDPADPEDPVARMGRPVEAELRPDPGDLEDSIADQDRRPVPFMVQKHPDRVILLVTSACHFYCRFCFRREQGVGKHREPRPADLERALEYVAGNPLIEEVILSGGDPLTLSDDRLRELGERIRAVPTVRRWRIHTRAPVHQPDRITERLVDRLDLGFPLRVVVHFDHPREVTGASREAVGRFLGRGMPVLNQSVLLKGVNDDPDCLGNLFRALGDAGVIPYYLHHPDRAPGNAHFRVTVERGLRLYRGLRERVPPELRPRYVVDLPDGTGKVPVEELQRVGPGDYRFDHGDGRRSEYRDIPPDPA